MPLGSRSRGRSRQVRGRLPRRARRYVLDTILATAAEHAGAEVRPWRHRDRRTARRARRWSGWTGGPGSAGRARRSVCRRRRRPPVAGRRAGRRHHQRGGWHGRRHSVRLLRGRPTGSASSSSSPSGPSPACSQPRRAGLHLGLQPSADAKQVRRRTGSRVEGFDTLIGAFAPRAGLRLRHAWYLAGAGHAPPAQPATPGLRPGWALVGDAGYYRDAVTAYGISDAFRDAELLAVALDQALEATARSPTTRHSAAARPGAAGDLRDHLPPGGLPAGADVHRAAGQLGAAIDKDAAALAARPVPGQRLLATA